ncbi:MAG: hypothetical protein ACI88A_004462, partial [Paraglaciecola sp.]
KNTPNISLSSHVTGLGKYNRSEGFIYEDF